MTLKYESEILFDLMKRDGDDTPSDVLPYESELKEKYLQQVEGAYPKLQDYRPEWLNYNLNAHIPADFPVESVSNVTNATFENVVPYAYGSAILKGQTLVNVFKRDFSKTFSEHLELLKDGWFKVTANGQVRYMFTELKNNPIKPNTKYLVKFEFRNNTLVTSNQNCFMVFGTSGVLADTGITIKPVNQTHIITTKENFEGKSWVLDAYLDTVASSGSVEIRIKIIEYQEGMENWDIPYFEGMQSVKMPVLTTSNEDDTKTNILTCNEDVELRKVGDVQDELDCLTGELTQRIGEIVLDGSEEWLGSPIGSAGTFMRFYTIIKDAYLSEQSSSILCDRFTSISHSNWDVAIEGIHGKQTAIHINIPTSKLESNDASSFKKWLSSNPVTVCYPLATESIKTLDLTVTDQDGKTTSIIRPIEGTMHVSTSSQTLPPLLDMSVPVEATSQNLMSFANILEGE